MGDLWQGIWLSFRMRSCCFCCNRTFCKQTADTNQTLPSTALFVHVALKKDNRRILVRLSLYLEVVWFAIFAKLCDHIYNKEFNHLVSIWWYYFPRARGTSGIHCVMNNHWTSSRNHLVATCQIWKKMKQKVNIFDQALKLLNFYHTKLT